MKEKEHSSSSASRNTIKAFRMEIIEIDSSAAPVGEIERANEIKRNSESKKMAQDSGFEFIFTTFFFPSVISSKSFVEGKASRESSVE